MEPPLFREVQKQRSPFLRSLKYVPLVFSLIYYFQQFLISGFSPAPEIHLICLSSIIVSVLVVKWVGSIQLITELYPHQVVVNMKHFPGGKWSAPTDLIKHSYIREFSGLTDFGGYGVRRSLSDKGICYTVSGNMGWQLELTNGQKVLIGTQEPEKLREILKQHSMEKQS